MESKYYLLQYIKLSMYRDSDTQQQLIDCEVYYR